MNNVLIITAYFPPTERVGAFRAAKFVKHLRQHGWTPYVLTREGAKQQDSVNQLSDAVNEAEAIHRSKEVIESAELNDVGLRWIPNLIREGNAIIDKCDIDVIFHTGEPFPPMLTSYLLDVFKDTPYVLDLRDPWSLRHDYTEPTGLLSYGYRTLTTVLEPLVFRRADTVIMNTDVMRSEYKKKYPDLGEKFVTITNGFDTKKYQSEMPEHSSDGFQIVYPGKFYDDIEPIFRSFKTLFEFHPEAKFVHMGNPDPKAQRLTKEFDLERNVEFRGYVDTSEVINTLHCSDIGLALGRDVTHIPMKVYDYIGCNLPILAVGPQDGALIDLISRFDGGYTVSQTNMGEIKKTLKSVLTTKPERLGETRRLEPYEFKNLTRELAEVFNEIN